jgi:hypothetical protein
VRFVRAVSSGKAFLMNVADKHALFDTKFSDIEGRIDIGEPVCQVAVRRLIDPVIVSITAEKDDLEDLTVLLPRLRRARSRSQTPRTASGARAPALSAKSREVIDVVMHGLIVALCDPGDKLSMPTATIVASNAAIALGLLGKPAWSA